MVKLCVGVLGLIGYGSAAWSPEHAYSSSDSASIATKIKNKIIAGANTLVDVDFKNKLLADLNIADDSKRQVVQISAVSANQLFGLLGVYDPGCDKNGDNVIKGDELKCLNFAWRSFLP